MTNIKEVIHLYLGCEAYIFPVNTYSDGWLSKQLKKLPDLQYSIEITTSSLQGIIADGYAPMLRRLDSITMDEINERMRLAAKWNPFEKTVYCAAEQTAYLLKQGFDLFGLIDSGQAIDKNLKP